MKVPRVIIAGTNSGVGKTTTTLAVISALKNKGLKVKPYKVGPDYIDPQFHSLLAGATSDNLDLWMIPRERIFQLLADASTSFNISVIEGVMGLLDGFGSTDEGSTLDLARITGTPIILVIDGYGLSGSAAAIVKGFKDFSGDLLAGVIVTRVSGERHYDLIKKAIEDNTNVRVLGYIEKNDEVRLESRHLGLVQASELNSFSDYIERLSKVTHINVDGIIEIARASRDLDPKFSPLLSRVGYAKIAVAYDSAFDFYYEENFRVLRNLGAELVFFSPLNNEIPPEDTDGLYIGGGYPEVFAKKLAYAVDARENIAKLIKKGVPTLAECGGYMYLTRTIVGQDGIEYPGVGIVPAKTFLTDKLILGYREIVSKTSNMLLRHGETARGHEFHRSTIQFQDKVDHPFVLKYKDRFEEDGYYSNNVVASYVHIHFLSNIAIPKRFVEECIRYSKKREIS
ncbi:cobyrinic acid a c-diamide synthase [Thermoplasma volcanium GSS1]|uniref:Cobyrinate a,c-diamide synthase n=1 Tax=Thermoplasma volcanium (strain ATCC 51530 / DSM 4299 / JCM 9571 / NBRC 15438 / GSS1) TaxID=273116 RepID=CBIA_THEVO|nr:cobyrinate a,c-diamide synthase [Thermoplasma volcanium]Q97BP4.1 RecName: Full=Cobyrinate a,c-diamide synthase; AltName: Full=Cobyrinic acid a,c-diamide synthetase [Thermoplasma volcanium GSS1]BAB59553.1 cobyrinic acid a c-diamide synthase [Thermoplasma volcanium GSS1]